jgi:hypothetical protein
MILALSPEGNHWNYFVVLYLCQVLTLTPARTNSDTRDNIRCKLCVGSGMVGNMRAGLCERFDVRMVEMYYVCGLTPPAAREA